MAAVLVVVILGLAGTAVLAVLVIALLRHVKLLAGSVAEFNAAVTPLLEQIRDGSTVAQDRIQSLSENRPGGTPGGRLRR